MREFSSDIAFTPAVKAIQRALNWHQATTTPIPTDGVFSQTTRNALIAFQQKVLAG